MNTEEKGLIYTCATKLYEELCAGNKKYIDREIFEEDLFLAIKQMIIDTPNCVWAKIPEISASNKSVITTISSEMDIPFRGQLYQHLSKIVQMLAMIDTKYQDVAGGIFEDLSEDTDAVLDGLYVNISKMRNN